MGLVSHLCGISNQKIYEGGPLYSPLFENYVIAESLKKHTHHKTHSKLYYYRTSHRVEIDLIIDHRQYKELIEIKTSETFQPKMTKSMGSILEPQDQGALVYRGATRPYDPKIKVLNYKDYLSQPT